MFQKAGPEGRRLLGKRKEKRNTFFGINTPMRNLKNVMDQDVL